MGKKRFLLPERTTDRREGQTSLEVALTIASKFARLPPGEGGSFDPFLYGRLASYGRRVLQKVEGV